MIEHANIIYVRDISCIGGVETWLYELVKKYRYLDIAVVCKDCDVFQRMRLEKYCRVYNHTNQLIKCKVAVINYDTSIIDYITKDIWKENAKDGEGIFQTIHTDYSHPDMGKPPQDDRIKSYLAITQYILDGYKEMIHCDNIMLCRNPLEIEDKKTMIIVSPTRLTDNKGGDLMLQLANTLDNLGISFLWFVITSAEYKSNVIFRNKNVIYVPSRLDTGIFYDIADWCVLPSKVEGDSYTLREALYRNVGIVVRELPYFKEIGIEDGKNALYINESNVLEIANKMVKPLKFKFEPIQDSYDKVFYKSKSKYEEERKMKVEVRCVVAFTDMEANRDRILNETWLCSRERGEYLSSLKLVEITRTIKEEKKEKATPKTKVEKAVR